MGSKCFGFNSYLTSVMLRQVSSTVSPWNGETPLNLQANRNHVRMSTWKPTSCKSIFCELSPGQTQATSQRNILQHCCGQRITRVWPPFSNMLQEVGLCWIKFENGQMFVAAFLDVPRCCARLASSFTTSHNTIQQWSKLLWATRECKGFIISNDVDVDCRKLFEYKGFRWGWGCIVTSFFFSKKWKGTRVFRHQGKIV